MGESGKHGGLREISEADHGIADFLAGLALIPEDRGFTRPAAGFFRLGMGILLGSPMKKPFASAVRTSAVRTSRSYKPLHAENGSLTLAPYLIPRGRHPPDSAKRRTHDVSQDACSDSPSPCSPSPPGPLLLAGCNARPLRLRRLPRRTRPTASPRRSAKELDLTDGSEGQARQDQGGHPGPQGRIQGRARRIARTRPGPDPLRVRGPGRPEPGTWRIGRPR